MITLFWVLPSTMFASSVGMIALTIFDALKARKQSAYEWSDCKTAHRRLDENLWDLVIHSAKNRRSQERDSVSTKRH